MMVTDRRLLLVTLAPALLATSCPPTGASTEHLEVARELYETYGELVKNGNDVIEVQITGNTPFDLSDTEAAKSRITEAIADQAVVMPYALGRSASQSWVHGHLTARDDVIGDTVGRRVLDEVMQGIDEGAWAGASVLEMRLEADGQVVTYPAFLFVRPESPPSIELIDPVMLGADDLLDLDLGAIANGKTRAQQHGMVGAPAGDTWLGCEEAGEATMTQGTMRHEDKGTCVLSDSHLVSPLFGQDGSYDCPDDGFCNTDAIAKISCKTQDPGCPRRISSTAQSGDCHAEAHGTETCAFLVCPTGTDLQHHNIQVRADTVAGMGLAVNGLDVNCSIHTNIELLQFSEGVFSASTSSVQWKVTYTTPATPAGGAGIEFTGTTPSHSVYQVFQQTMCCVVGHLECTEEGTCEMAPGSGEDTCTSDDDCDLGCTEEGTCEMGGGEGTCTTDDDCNLGCTEEGTCEMGGGEGTCTTDDDCDLGCTEEGTCEMGGGEGTCTSADDCNHQACVEGACMQVNMPGEDSCSDDTECHHLECVDDACIQVNMPGENQCTIDPKSFCACVGLSGDACNACCETSASSSAEFNACLAIHCGA